MEIQSFYQTNNINKYEKNQIKIKIILKRKSNLDKF